MIASSSLASARRSHDVTWHDSERANAATVIQTAWRERQNASKDREVMNAVNDASMRKLRIYLLFEEPTSSPLAKMTQFAVLATIVLSIMALSMETMPELWGVIPSEFWCALEAFCTFVFTVEYGFRLWSCTVVQSRASFIAAFFNMTDLLALVPFYIDLFLIADSQDTGNSPILHSVRVFRLIRLFRLFKLGRHFSSMQLMFRTLANSMQALVVLLFLLVIGVILFSTIMFHAERQSCVPLEDIPLERRGMIAAHREALTCPNTPRVGWSLDGLCCDKYNSPLNFRSIVHTFWWSIVTITTVGYGDVVPHTPQGKVIAALSMLMGILLVTLPVAIVGWKFQEVYEETQVETKKNKKPQTRIQARKKLEQVLRRETLDVLEDWKWLLSPTALEGWKKKPKQKLNTARGTQTVRNATKQRKVTFTGKILDLHDMRLKDHKCSRMVKQLCAHLSEYQSIMEDHIQMHQSYTKRSVQLFENVNTLLEGLGNGGQNSQEPEDGAIIVE